MGKMRITAKLHIFAKKCNFITKLDKKTHKSLVIYRKMYNFAACFE